MKSLKLISIQICLLLLVIILITSCKPGELNRSKAQDLINEDSSFKYPFLVQYTGESLKYNEGVLQVISDSETKEQAAARKIKKYMELNPQIGVLYHYGLVEPQVTAREDKAPARVYVAETALWHFNERYVGTPKAEKYWQDYNLPPRAEALPLALRELTEVTGITARGDNQAVAEFKYSWKPNEIGKAFDSSTSEFKSLSADLQKLLNGEKIPDGEIRGTDSRIDWATERTGRGLFQRYDDGWRLMSLEMY